MPTIPPDLDVRTRAAVKYFWENIDKAQAANKDGPKADHGNRGGKTSGQHMRLFTELLKDVVKDNGLPADAVKFARFPGFFRPTKDWDVTVRYGNRLVAAIEFKSATSSVGNNVNNRSEEAIGSAYDFWTLFKQDKFGKIPRPFLGFLHVLADSDEVQEIKKDLRAWPFQNESYLGTNYTQRYGILCEKLVEHGLYSAATVILTPKEGGTLRGDYHPASQNSTLHHFVTALAAHIERAVTDLVPAVQAQLFQLPRE